MTVRQRFAPWYHEQNDDDVARSCVMAASRIADQLSGRRTDDQLYMRMYGVRDPAGTGEESPKKRERLRYNIGRSIVETAENAVGSQQIRPRFVTNDAVWSTMRKARACEMVVDGEFRRSRFYEDLAPLVFVDAAVSSIGAVKVFRDGGHPVLERIEPGTLLVDERDGRNGKPRTMWHVGLVNREVLLAKYKGDEKVEGIIRTAAGPVMGSGYSSTFAFLRHTRAHETDDVVVIESWHLPDREPRDERDKKHGGRHCIVLTSGPLLVEEWRRTRFPIAVYRWSKRQVGFYGMGIIEQIRSHQRNLNYLDGKITDLLHKVTRVYTAVHEKSRVKATHLDNDPTTLIRYSGAQPPQVMAQNAVPKEYWQKRREIIDDAYAECGVSRYEAQQEKPAGVTAGIALQELHDSQSRRLRKPINAWERFCLDVAELIIEEKNAIALDKDDEDKTRVRVRRGSQYHATDIAWSDVMLAPGDYEIESQAAGALPDTSAGRSQTVLDWYKAGFINQLQAKVLLDMPDLEQFKSLDLAPYEVILDAIESIIEDGEYIFPEPSDDLALAEKLAVLSYQKYKLRKAPPERLEMLLTYADDARALMEQAMQADAERQAGRQAGEAMAGMAETAPGGQVSPIVAAELLRSGPSAPLQSGMPPVQAVA